MALSGQKLIRGCGRRKRMIWIKEGNIEIEGTVEEVRADYTIITKAVRNRI